MNMEFNVAQLMKELVGAKRSYEFDTPTLVLSERLSDDTGERLARDVHGTIQLTRLRRQLRATGHVSAKVDLECGRCLEDFAAEVEAPLEELFRQTVDVVSGMPVAAEDGEDEDDAFPIDHNHIVNLTEPVRQALLVALPMQPLCRVDCRGLCPVCGTNLNESQCDCVVEDFDPRLSALASLLSEEDQGAGPA